MVSLRYAAVSALFAAASALSWTPPMPRSRFLPVPHRRLRLEGDANLRELRLWNSVYALAALAVATSACEVQCYALLRSGGKARLLATDSMWCRITR